MEQTIKSKISLYGFISGITFIYLILNDSFGISVPLYFVTQFILFYMVSQNKEAVNKRLAHIGPCFYNIFEFFYLCQLLNGANKLFGYRISLQPHVSLAGS